MPTGLVYCHLPYKINHNEQCSCFMQQNDCTSFSFLLYLWQCTRWSLLQPNQLHSGATLIPVRLQQTNGWNIPRCKHLKWPWHCYHELESQTQENQQSKERQRGGLFCQCQFQWNMQVVAASQLGVNLSVTYLHESVEFLVENVLCLVAAGKSGGVCVDDCDMSGGVEWEVSSSARSLVLGAMVAAYTANSWWPVLHHVFCLRLLPFPSRRMCILLLVWHAVISKATWPAKQSPMVPV